MSHDAVASRVADHLGFTLSEPQRRRLRRTVEDRDAADRGGAAMAVPGTPAFDALVEAVLVGETYWFRDVAQLEVVAAVLADVAPVRRRVWCAGAASGQEAWSLAITLHRAGVWPVEIVASDLSRPSVRAAREAAYPLARQRGLDPATAAAYGRTSDGVWSPLAELREQVTAVHHDLLRDPPFPATVILCRNVLIYLTAQAVARAMTQLDRGLAPDGTLVLGHAETRLAGPRWQAARLGGTFVFSRKSVVASTAGAPLPTARPRPSPPPAPVRPHAAGPARPQAGIVVGDGADALLRAGEQALSVGAHQEAIGLLRQVRYLRGHDAVPAVLLGIALDRAGQPASARRSWTVAWSLLDGLAEDARLLGGYPSAAVRRWVQGLLDGEGT